MWCFDMYLETALQNMYIAGLSSYILFFLRRKNETPGKIDRYQHNSHAYWL